LEVGAWLCNCALGTTNACNFILLNRPKKKNGSIQPVVQLKGKGQDFFIAIFMPPVSIILASFSPIASAHSDSDSDKPVPASILRAPLPRARMSWVAFLSSGWLIAHQP
jgi:hypothetical protein